MDETLTLKDVREKAEKEHIEKVLNENRWNLTKVAILLDIDRKTLYNKIDKYKIV